MGSEPPTSQPAPAGRSRSCRCSALTIHCAATSALSAGGNASGRRRCQEMVGAAADRGPAHALAGRRAAALPRPPRARQGGAHRPSDHRPPEERQHLAQGDALQALPDPPRPAGVADRDLGRARPAPSRRSRGSPRPTATTATRAWSAQALAPGAPDSPLRHKPILLLARNPLDIAVSWYFQFTRRQSAHKQELINHFIEHPIDRRTIGMWDFVRHSDIGLPLLIDYLNRWERNLARPRARADGALRGPARGARARRCGGSPR